MNLRCSVTDATANGNRFQFLTTLPIESRLPVVSPDNGYWETVAAWRFCSMLGCSLRMANTVFRGAGFSLIVDDALVFGLISSFLLLRLLPSKVDSWWSLNARKYCRHNTVCALFSRECRADLKSSVSPLYNSIFHLEVTSKTACLPQSPTFLLQPITPSS